MKLVYIFTALWLFGWYILTLRSPYFGAFLLTTTVMYVLIQVYLEHVKNRTYLEKVTRNLVRVKEKSTIEY